jgi:CheY-like chemotaxis protein
MNKVIEADFLPRGTNADFSWPRSIGDSGMKERRRILIVDNDPDATHLVKVLLEKTGHYLVLEENDATKAHQDARNFRPDLILLDVVMPDTDGGEVAARIEADPELHNTPIVFLTALVTRGGKEWSPYPRASISCKACQHSWVDQRNSTTSSRVRSVQRFSLRGDHEATLR